MAKIPELLDGHVTLEVECLDRLYLNGYIGGCNTGRTGDVHASTVGKPIPSPVVLGQVSEMFREAVKAQAERQQIPIDQFQHKERKDDLANEFRRQRGVRDPAGKWKQFTTDVSGNLTMVLEPDPANQPSGTLVMNYSYDWMNHVTGVTMPRGATPHAPGRD